MKYNYLESIKEDVKNYIEENKENESYDFDNIEGLKEILYEDLWIDDSVTGNGSGSYTFSTYQAEENIAHNMDLLKEACEEFGANAFEMLENPEKADVTIRCYLLGQAINEVVEEMTKEKNKTIVKIKKIVKYTITNEDKTQTTTEKELFTRKTDILSDAIKILDDEKLSCYNSKYLQVNETIEATYKTATGYKKIYKTIDLFNGNIKKNY